LDPPNRKRRNAGENILPKTKEMRLAAKGVFGILPERGSITGLVCKADLEREVMVACG
jgi:hypothetical protein